VTAERSARRALTRLGEGEAKRSALPAPPPLRPPAGRQGPGPVPLARLAALDLRLSRRTAAPLPGEHLAVGAGAGVELAQLRPYVPGDDVRAMDPAATARTGVPHVRVHVPERALTTWVVLDVSASMAFGTADRLKADVAEGVATVAGRLATRRGNRMALITCGAAVERVLPPRGGRGALTHLRQVLAEGVATDTPPPSSGGAAGAPASGLGAGLRRADKLARGHGLVVVVSDFLEEPGAWESPLRALRHRHDVVAVEVRDRRDEALPAVGTLWLRDPETGRQLQVDTNSRRLRERFAAAATARQAETAGALTRLGVRHAVCRTDGDWLGALGTVLR
jgi:uncharacterized protein (DUF58 family)